MDIEKRPDGYWITSLPDSPDAGPYNTKAGAASDRKGLRRFFKYEHDRAFFTVDRRRSNEEATIDPANSDFNPSRDSANDSAQLLRTCTM